MFRDGMDTADRTSESQNLLKILRAVEPEFQLEEKTFCRIGQELQNQELSRLIKLILDTEVNARKLHNFQ